MNILENYRAVCEGKLSEREFLRQMRQGMPGYINQFTSYKDAVGILKRRGILTEEFDQRCQADKFPLESIDRGIRYELKQMGIDCVTEVSRGDYKEAKKKAIANLCKDPLYYIHKICPEKKVDTDQRMKPVKVEKKSLQESRRFVRRPVAKPVVESKEMKLLKEAITKKVTSILSEAATANLAQFSDENASVQGIPAILNNLENVVTEIESFILKEQTKIQGIFDSIGAIKNEDGIPVGFKFVQPIMDSFQKDLEPVLQKISLDSIKLPDAPETDSVEPVTPEGEEEQPEVEPKQTVFSPRKKGVEEPLQESKKVTVRRRYTR